MLYLKLDFGTPGRVIWVPLSGPLNPSNLAIGSGHFCQVSERSDLLLHLMHLFQGPSLKFDMALKALTDDEKTELKEQFTVLDKDESGCGNYSTFWDIFATINYFADLLTWLN